MVVSDLLTKQQC